jgi:uncharacterized glyoxalase superfamily protein PhnB
MSVQTIFPALRYRDARAAIEWLERAFGFELRAVHEGPGGTIGHAELALDDAMIMVASVPDDDSDDREPVPGGTSIYVVVDDVDALADRARAAGADVVRGPLATDYGSREFGARDLEGNSWSFGTYQPWDA